MRTRENVNKLSIMLLILKVCVHVCLHIGVGCGMYVDFSVGRICVF